MKSLSNIFSGLEGEFFLCEDSSHANVNTINCIQFLYKYEAIDHVPRDSSPTTLSLEQDETGGRLAQWQEH